MRTLVLGSMPEGAAPQTHIASGPWCFSGREDLFPGWDGSQITGDSSEPPPPAEFPQCLHGAPFRNPRKARIIIFFPCLVIPMLMP